MPLSLLLLVGHFYEELGDCRNGYGTEIGGESCEPTLTLTRLLHGTCLGCLHTMVNPLI